jgi:hypothetical protein
MEMAVPMVITGQDVKEVRLIFDAAAADLGTPIEQERVCREAFNGSMENKERNAGTFYVGLDTHTCQGIALLSGQYAKSTDAYIYLTYLDYSRFKFARIGNRRKIMEST